LYKRYELEARRAIGPGLSLAGGVGSSILTPFRGPPAALLVITYISSQRNVIRWPPISSVRWGAAGMKGAGCTSLSGRCNKQPAAYRLPLHGSYWGCIHYTIWRRKQGEWPGPPWRWTPVLTIPPCLLRCYAS